MKLRFLSITLLLCVSIAAQLPNPGKKYPSVFWEITGNGLSKPSYLFGTMHISSKLAFHLSDSFYVAIKSVDKVALELNPEDWQKDMYDYRQKQMGFYTYRGNARSNSSLSVFETTFKYKDFEKDIIEVLGYEPSVVNNLLYREREGQMDFEEDTYLDLYIYQTGRKLGKQGLGVENYLESAKIEEEGHVLQEKEKNKDKKSRQSTYGGDFYEELSDAYRKGDLDKLDSLEQLQMTSPAYWEKFLYERNVVQANNIAKILKNSSLFVGVGSAHLPGDRGVIELLRKMGYKLRPIFMKQRDAKQKGEIDKIKVPVSFQKHTLFDGQITCVAPGTMYELDSYLNRKKYLYSDMANGSYYLVTQFSTKSSLMHLSETELMDKVDRFLYEGIPGEIVEKKTIKEGDYKGFYIKNKTKKGDYQRYKILFTPFDIFVFKIAGKQDYVNGPEGDAFISSVHLNSMYTARPDKTYMPASGGYSVDLKYTPLVSYEEYSGESSLAYADTVQKLYTTIDHLYSFNGDYLSDSAFLALCEESTHKSEDFEKLVQRKSLKGDYGHTLEIIDSCKGGYFRATKFVLTWPHIYVLTSVGSLEMLKNNYVSNSFNIKDYKTGKDTLFVDSLAQFKMKVSGPVVLDHEFGELYRYLEDLGRDEHYVPDLRNEYDTYELKDRFSGNSVGIYVQKFSKYYYSAAPNFGIDTLKVTKGKRTPVVLKESGRLPSGYPYYYYTFGYKGSLIEAHLKFVISNEKVFVLKAYTLKGKDLPQYCKSVFETFEPVFAKKSNLDPFKVNNTSFWKDYFSANDKTFKTYQEYLREIAHQPEDLSSLYKAYTSLSSNSDKYFEYKSDILSQMSYVGTYKGNVDFQPSIYVSDESRNYYYNNRTTFEDHEDYLLAHKDKSYGNTEDLEPDEKVQKQKLDLLVRLYREAGDTLNLQRSVLEAISSLKTKEAFEFVKNILIDDPLITSGKYGESLSGIFSPMSDTLPLAKTLFPAIMQLTVIGDDYKSEIIDLLDALVQYQKIKPAELKKLSSIVFEANLQFKKQRLNDEKVLIAKNADDEDASYSYYSASNDKFTLNSSLADFIGLIAYLYKIDDKATKLVDKMLMSPNKVLLSEIVAELLFKKKPVSDSLILSLGTDPYYSYSFYNKLRIRKLTQKFPHHKVSQRTMTEIMLKNDLKKYDTIAYLGNRYVEMGGKSGYVYIYKYKIKRLDDWKLTTVGIQPKDTSKVNISEFINETYNKPLKDAQQVSTIVDEILHKKSITLIKAGFYNDRDSYSSSGYNYGSYDDYED